MEQFIHYIGLAYFQQPIRAMQFKAAKLQKQSRFKSCFKAAFFKIKKQLQKAAQRNAAQRSAARRMLRLKAQRMCEHTCMQKQRSAAQRSTAHHMLRLKATCIYSAAQRSAAQRSAAYVWTHLYSRSAAQRSAAHVWMNDTIYVGLLVGSSAAQLVKACWSAARSSAAANSCN